MACDKAGPGGPQANGFPARPFPVELRFALFDFDGVIADTEPLYIECDRKALALLGYEATHEELRSFIGHPSEKMGPELLARHGIHVTPQEFLAVWEGGRGIYGDPDLRPSPGLIELWNLLNKADVRIGVVSSTRCASLVLALNRFGMLGLVDVMVGRELVSRHKPNPEPYLRALEWLAPGEGPKAAAHAIAFEDSAAGIASAGAAGIHVVGYQGATETRDSPGADETISSFSEMAKRLVRDLP